MSTVTASSETNMGTWTRVGTIEDIPELGARVVKSAAGDIAVFRNAENEVFALRDKCPHKGGPLSQGIVFGRHVACPLHNWTIGLADGCATLGIPVTGGNVSFYNETGATAILPTPVVGVLGVIDDVRLIGDLVIRAFFSSSECWIATVMPSIERSWNSLAMR